MYLFKYLYIYVYNSILRRERLVEVKWGWEDNWEGIRLKYGYVWKML